jgi:sugar O-acyltransferase (sialic acid O-acetyltransferase NeuD family)
MIENIVIIGAGGHAKVVAATALAMGIAIDGIYDDDPEKRGRDILKIPVLGPLSDMDKRGSLKAVLAIGDNATRKRLSDRFIHSEWITLIHPSAFVHPSVTLGRGTVVFANAVVQPDTHIGDHCIINTGATVDHDCTIGDFCHIAPGVNLAGDVHIQEGVFLGIGSSVIIGKRIGEWATVGAGGVVIRDIPSHSVAVGIPAKILRRGNEKEL